MKELIKQNLITALNQYLKENSLHLEAFPAIEIEHAKDLQHGDFASNIAMVLAKPLSKPPRIIAEEAKALNIPLIHFSTDFVFDGKKSTPYLETDRPSPISVYGLSKLEGEKSIQKVDGDYLIFRTAWVYSRQGNNFRNTIRQLAKKRPKLNIINDQVGSPTTTTYISLVLKKVIELLFREKEIPFQECKGIYHLTCGGTCSWYDFAEVIIKDLFQHEEGHCTLNPISTKDYTTAATRPKYSVLNNQKLTQVFGLEQREWQDCFQEMG